MVLEIIVVSEAKGSNPGGRCLLSNESNLPLPVYVKHCTQSRIRRGVSDFIPEHQPIYEAITFQMGEKIGLNTPKFYVLLNKERNLKFTGCEGTKLDIKQDWPFYFVSELVMPPESEEPSEYNPIIEREAVYRDLLQISDIVGRKHNFCYRDGKVIYFDLGCSFIDAHMNAIELHNKHGRPLDKKEMKRALRTLDRWILIGNDNISSLSLADFVELPRYLSLPTLNPKGKVPLKNLISEAEIEEIIGRLASGIFRSHYLQRNEGSPYLRRATDFFKVQ